MPCDGLCNGTSINTFLELRQVQLCGEEAVKGIDKVKLQAVEVGVQMWCVPYLIQSQLNMSINMGEASVLAVSLAEVTALRDARAAPSSRSAARVAMGGHS
jgi:hypothetical protein